MARFIERGQALAAIAGGHVRLRKLWPLPAGQMALSLAESSDACFFFLSALIIKSHFA